mgnify:CR=1 FL=1
MNTGIATISTAIIAVEIGLRLLAGNLQFEQAFFILVLAPEFYFPLRQLGLRFHAGMSAVTAAQRIYEFLHNKHRSDSVLENLPVTTGAITMMRSLWISANAAATHTCCMIRSTRNALPRNRSRAHVCIAMPRSSRRGGGSGLRCRERPSPMPRVSIGMR